MKENSKEQKENPLRDLIYQLENKVISQQLIKEAQLICTAKALNIENKEQIARILYQKGFEQEGIIILQNILNDADESIDDKFDIPEILLNLGCNDESLSAWLKLLDLDPNADFFEKRIAQKQIFQNRWEKKIVEKLMNSDLDIEERKHIIDTLVNLRSFRAISLLLEEFEVEIPLFLEVIKGWLSWNEMLMEQDSERNFDAILKDELIKVIESDLFSLSKRKAAITALHIFTNGDNELKQLIEGKGLELELQSFSQSVISNSII